MSRPRRTTPPSTFFPLPSFTPEPRLPTTNITPQTHVSTSTSPPKPTQPLSPPSLIPLITHLTISLRPWTAFFSPSRLSLPTNFTALGKGDLRRGVDAYLSRIERNWRYYWANYAVICLAVGCVFSWYYPRIPVVAALWGGAMVASARLEDPMRFGKHQTVPKSNVYFLVSSVAAMILYVFTGMGCIYPLSVSGAIVLSHSTFHKPPARSVVINAYNKRSGASSARGTSMLDAMDDLVGCLLVKVR
ncbi:hypothetical protein HDV00_009912 [Rhizophlyctis rosea]|nr:hypothetical protein HDV00_009912 [Rhizophlyctis rosea]